MGRPSNRKRTEFGQRVFEHREAIGLTQAAVASQLGLSQRAYAAWERDPVAIRPERLSRLAVVLQTSVAELVGEVKGRSSAYPSKGRMRRSLNALSKLPRHQQAKILDVVDAMLAQQSAGAA